MDNSKFTKAELIEDIDFLASRIHLTGCFSTGLPRSWGAASNSLLEIAYGQRELKDTVMPSDKSDWIACQNLIGMIPLHRKIKIKEVSQAYHLQEEKFKCECRI